jgi:hypothetical protein
MRNSWLSPRLDWRGDLFPARKFALTTNAASSPRGKLKTDEFLCRCGCKLPHNYSVSRITEDHGHRHVLWYRHVDHRNRDAYKELGHV